MNYTERRAVSLRDCFISSRLCDVQAAAGETAEANTGFKQRRLSRVTYIFLFNFFLYFFYAFSLRCTSRGVTNISCLSPVTGGTVCQHRHVVEAETVRSTVSSRDLLALS